MNDDTDTDDDVLAQDGADTELEPSEARWQSVVENSPDYIVLVDFEGRIQFLNHAHEALGNAAALDTSIYDYCLPEYHAIVREKLNCVRQTGQSESYELRAEGPHGTVSWYSSRVGPVWHQGKITSLMIVSTDITERKRIEQELVQARAELEQRVVDRTAELTRLNATLAASEERFRQLAENIEVVFWLCSADLSRLEYVSPSFARIWEMDPAEVYQDPRRGLARVHPDDQARLFARIGTGMPTEQYESEFRLLFADGRIRWIRARAFSVFDEEHQVTHITGLAEDITERKKAREELLAERSFLRQLLAAHERDQKLTAHEIHDGLLQDLIAALLQLENLAEQGLAGRDDQRAQLELALRLLREAVGEGRRLISGLRPLAIDQQGIVAGIQHLVDAQRARQRATIRFQHDVHFERLDPFVEGMIFRLVQEALNNAARHSAATEVEIGLTDDRHTLVLVVRDNGIGFDTGSQLAQGWGLEGLRKRAQLLGGQAEVMSAPQQGTTVRIELPLAADLPRSAPATTSSQPGE
ncbi:MAG: PAS domain S-box protein [Planctomycetaceae bacterium]|nr:PAS domain S-box protein [Planctomycetaceae bacterium]